MKRVIGLAVLAGAAGVAASAATAAPLPTGPWACAKTAASAGPAADQDKGSGAGEALAEHLWVLDGGHYALSSQDDGAYGNADTGLYRVQGGEMVGQSGPLAQVPMHARIASGADGRPAITLEWASAPGLAMTCQPAS